MWRDSISDNKPDDPLREFPATANARPFRARLVEIGQIKDSSDDVGTARWFDDAFYPAVSAVSGRV